MTPHEFRPSQVRALLLLLAIVPLIPTVLMVRFMVDSVDDERTAAFERLSALYQQTLTNASATLARNVADQKATISADEARLYFRDLFDRDVLVRVIDNEGKPVSGTTLATGAPVAQISLRELGRPWSVQVFFVDSEALNLEQRQQFRAYMWIVGTVVIGILAFALAGALTVSRQLELRELRSTAVATVAHELRTPLAAMRMLVDTLRDGRFRNEQQLREYLDLLAQENERLSRLAEHFLTFTRLARGKQRLDLTPIDPQEAAHDAIAALGPRLEAPQCEFSVEIGADLPRVKADRDALATVLTNLLDNALKYTDQEKRIALRAAANGRTVTFSVEDNGPGISAADRKHIFRPFHQADTRLARSRQGVGLGLSIVKDLVAALHGRIELDSKPGQGSRFSIVLPTA